MPDCEVVPTTFVLTDEQQALLQAATRTGVSIMKVVFDVATEPSRANPSEVVIHVWTPRVGEPWRQVSVYAMWRVLARGQRFDHGCVHVCREKKTVEYGPKRTDLARMMGDISDKLESGI